MDHNIIIKKLFDAYKTFYAYSALFPKKDKYTLGAKCELQIISVLELLLEASWSSKEEKIVLLKKASIKFDMLKIFIRLLKDLNILDNKKYLDIQTQLQEIGRMLGGWQKSLTNKNPENGTL